MAKYIALLRGINVGGKNKISMAALKSAMTEQGFAELQTYINSGNIIFSSNGISEEELARRCEDIIADRFDLDIRVLVISAADFALALQNAPEWWDADADAKHNAIFALTPHSTEEIIADIGATKPEYERLAWHGRVIFWTAPIKTFSRTRLSKIVGTTTYTSVTIRNANTAKKLLNLVE